MRTLLLASAASLALASAALHGAEPKPKPADPKAKPAGPAAKPQPIELFPDKVLARTKNFSIKASKVEQEFTAFRSAMAAQGRIVPEAQRAEHEKKILDRLIVTEIMLIKADDSDRAKAREVVDKFFAEMTRRVGSEDALKRQIESTGAAVGEYRGKLLERAISEQVFLREVKEKVAITPEAAKKFYDENPGRFETPEMVRASHILLGTRDAATQLDLNDAKKAEKRRVAEGVLERARKGEDFGKLAKDFSEDPGSKDKGGEYVFPRGQMVAEFEAVAFSMKTNEVSDIVTTKFGYHIIKLSEKIPAKKSPFTEVEPQIKDFLSQQEADKQLPTYLEKLRKDAGVEYLDDRYKP
jgi:peptidyl-prolyl cis-trans isomerase C